MNRPIFWPDVSERNAIDYVGYNHAIKLLLRAAGDMITPAVTSESLCRLYCNIPWHHDPASLKREGLPLVAYTMFEATKLPTRWTRFLNDHCRAVIVPTLTVRDIFRISGVQVPIKIVSLGVDTEAKRPIERKPDGLYTYLWQGHTYDPNGRKGAGIAERAFVELRNEGRIGRNARLFMKYRPHQDWGMEIDNLEVGDNIVHIGRTLSPEAMEKLMSQTDCCINPSRGEGFGLIPLEQMAAGRPVLLTGWSYPFVNHKYNVPLRYDMKPSPVRWCHRHFSFGRWGLEYNLNGMIRVHMMPKLRARRSNGDDEYGVDLKPVRSRYTLRNALYNKTVDFQERIKLFWRPNLARHEIMFESPGYDAEVNIDDLKNRMEDCYHDPARYAEMGHRAALWVRESWGLNRIRKQLIQAINEFQTEGVL